MKGVIYARYSSDNQREESIDGQLRECVAYAEKQGITILTNYIDRALSAKTDDRPEFQRMVQDSSKKLFDVVLVWKLDRFSRNRYDSAHYKAVLRKNNVKVISATERISEGSEGILLESLLEGMAEYYSAELSEKIKRGHKENALKALNNGGNIPFGYLLSEDRKLIIDPIAAPIVQEIFTRYAEGETAKNIIRSLNQRGITTQKGKPFAPTVFTTMLRNRKYIGVYRYGDVVIDGGVPAILDKELFDRVQRRVAKNKHAPARAKATAPEPYLLTTKLFCGNCESMMAGESGRGRNGVHYYYKCHSAKRKLGCTQKAVKKQWIEDIVINHAMHIIQSDTIMEQVADAVLEEEQRGNIAIPKLTHQLEEVDKSLENMLNAIQQGIFTKSTKQRLDELEQQKEQLEHRIALERLERPSMTREQILYWLHSFRLLDITNVEHRRRIVDTFVNAVFVYDDRLVITYNYKDYTETVSIKEIEGSDLAGSTPAKATHTVT